MKKILSVLIFSLCLNFGLQAEDLLPSDNYYKENIAVNDIDKNSPFTRDDSGDPSGPGGEGESGNGGTWNGGHSTPIGDALLPISFIAVLYGVYVLVNKRKSKKA